ncbi:hypothetical protein [Streptomyces sp. NPDC054794]
MIDTERVEGRSESVEVEFAVPGAEIFLDEFDPVLRFYPSTAPRVPRTAIVSVSSWPRKCD